MFGPSNDNLPQISKNEAVVAFAPATTLNVVPKLSTVDTLSWEYVSQQASDKEFLAYMSTQNIFSSKVLNRLPPLLIKKFIVNQTASHRFGCSKSVGGCGTKRCTKR